MTSVREDLELLKKEAEEFEKNGKFIDKLLIKIESISSFIFSSELHSKDKQNFSQLKENMYYRRDKLWEESRKYLKKFHKLKQKNAKNL